MQKQEILNQLQDVAEAANDGVCILQGMEAALNLMCMGLLETKCYDSPALVALEMLHNHAKEAVQRARQAYDRIDLFQMQVRGN